MTTLLQIDWNPALGLKLGPIILRYYSLMFVIAFTLGLYLMKKIYIKDHIPLEKLDKLFIYTVIATILGARLGHVFFYDWAYYKNHIAEIILPFRLTPEFKFTGYAGLASHGAALGIIFALYFYSKRVLKESLLYILDRVVIVVALGGGFVRIGNLMNSEIIGKATGSNYGFIFRRLNEDFPRHPTQIYEALAYFAIFFLLWRVYWHTQRKLNEGYLFGLFMIFIWAFRFVIEFFKEAQIDDRATWTLNTGQWLSIPFVMVGCYYVSRVHLKK